MKVCPKCKVEYADDTLEFCLEDGTRLISSGSKKASAQGKTEVFNNFPAAPPANVSEVSKETILQNKDTGKIAHIKEKVTYQSYKTIEIAPIVLALAHNYWQWLYLNKTNYGDAVSFLTSGHFIVWLCLLFVGTVTSFTALKYAKNKDFAVTSLVILAINLLLSIVPYK